MREQKTIIFTQLLLLLLMLFGWSNDLETLESIGQVFLIYFSNFVTNSQRGSVWRMAYIYTNMLVHKFIFLMFSIYPMNMWMLKCSTVQNYVMYLNIIYETVHYKVFLKIY